jgi:hypothetical protein
MTDIWLVLIICLGIVVSAALPLLRQRNQQLSLPPAKETLRDWRTENRKSEP